MPIHAAALAALLVGAPSAATASGPETIALWPHGATGAGPRSGEPEIVENT